LGPDARPGRGHVRRGRGRPRRRWTSHDRGGVARCGHPPGRRVHADPGEPGDLRRAVRGIRPPPRLLRPWRERCHADPPAPALGRPPADHRGLTMLDAIKDDLVRLHAELPRHDLVVWTGGNVSARDPESGLVVIKPSGVRYEDLTADTLVVLDLDGRIVEGTHRPSSDTASHLYIYRNRPHANGVA